MPTVQRDSHRGKICQALSKEAWMTCHDVANTSAYSAGGASSILADVYRAGYVDRQQTEPTAEDRVEYEYRLRENVSFD
ncbi:hypothetical protein [Haloarchaeobius sp. DFWS5]|uniref:hypothetical protein n=1 Tax=Haloarchaeobius sp. DFWS5 TaxID=3446114 RepID=UPI003EBAEFFA